MGIFKFTGNPFIDNGEAVITALCGKECFEDVTEDDILNCLDNFFDDIKFCYNYENATAVELRYVNKGIKQHLYQIYTTNHYLHGINNYIKDENNHKKKVSNFDEYKESIRAEVKALLDGYGAHVHTDDETVKQNICRFCSRNADILLSKDIFPLMAGRGVNNMGLVYSCNYCYLASLFYYANMVNIKKDEKSSGFYMLYECSSEKALIEIAKLNLNHLRTAQKGSIETYIGNFYEGLVEDMEDKLPVVNRAIKVSNLNFTAYFIINDNRGGSLNSIDIPDGMWRFMAYSNNISSDWKKIKSHFKIGDYKKLIDGELSFDYFDDIPDCLKIYLKEVKRMNENLISAVENIGKDITDYLRLNGENWPVDYEKEYSKKKPYEFINSLLNINENYFKLKGKNLFDFEELKLVLNNYEKSSLIFSLAKYFIYNSMDEKERKFYVDYCKTVKNIDVDKNKEEK